MDQVSQLISRGLRRNRFEQAVLIEWVQVRGGIRDKLKDLIANPNPEGVPSVRVFVESPPSEDNRERHGLHRGPNDTYQAVLPDAVWTDVRGCRSCILGVLGACVYSLRERIPPEELPANARNRENCWYGRNCNTQRTRQDHAMRLNHIC